MNDDIVARFASLFPYERNAVLEALQRDAQSQLAKARADAAHAGCYLFNHRIVARVLDVLNADG